MAEEFAKSLERYDVVDRIAVGGMAEVFLAKAYGAHGFEKTLAIKRILPDLARDPEFEQRFIAEAKVAVKLSHTNIVQVMDFGRFAESLFIAMEYVDGLDLAALLRRYKDLGARVPVPAAFQIAIEIARGLDYAHQHGVVHRDVSPSNILISRAGEVKIADFGIAVAARPNRVAAGTGPRKVMGKWRYMSPEQARGEQLDTRSDLFSAAAVMYELFTGEKLFPGDEPEDIIKNIHDMALPRASRVRDGLPPRLDEILHPALARRALDRPSRAAVILRALTELSYESSIVCTTIDVSDAVATVLPKDATAASVVDEMIRRQLAGGEDVARETAVTDGKKRETLVTGHQSRAPGTAGIDTTGVFRHHIDLDGVSRLEQADPPEPADSTTMAKPRMSAVGPPAVSAASGAGASAEDRQPGKGPTLTGLGAAIAELGVSVPFDPDRRTEVGPPLAESRPFFKVEPGEPDKDDKDKTAAREKLDEDALTASRPAMARATTDAIDVPRRRATTQRPEPTPTATGPIQTAPSRRAWLALATVAIAGVAVAVYALTRPPPAPSAPIIAEAIDAAPPPPPAPPGMVELVSDPPGAAVAIDDAPSGTTPVTLEVAAGEHRIAMELPGRRRYETRITVASGGTQKVSGTLAVLRSQLRVTSVPDGATVKLGGVDLGRTPLDRDGLEPKKGVMLEVIRDGFERVRERIDLEPGKVTERSYTLSEGPRFGEVRITVKNGWANVTFNGKVLGVASATPFTGRLPIGRQTMRLINPENDKSAIITVDIVEGRVTDRAQVEIR
jgi:tRNA A-37 threonylcarbamoyl transferase component Bud32